MPDPEIQPPGFVDLRAFQRCAWQVYDDIYASRELLNSLNYFPVADFDTGNALSEFWAGLASSLLFSGKHALLGQAITEAVRRNSRVSGNSATIMGAWLTGFGTSLYNLDRADAAAFADALRNAAYTAKEAVPDPVQGTMLTVYDAVADAAKVDHGQATSFSVLFQRFPSAISTTLSQHSVPVGRYQIARPEHDAGAFAMRLMFHAMKKVLAPLVDSDLIPVRQFPLSKLETSMGDRPGHTLQEDVEIQLRVQVPADAIELLKSGLADLGDSLVVTFEPTVIPQIPPIWNIHFHTYDPDSVTALCARHGHVLRAATYPLTSGINFNSTPTRNTLEERHIVMIIDDLPDNQYFAEAEFFRSNEKARLLSRIQQLAPGSEMIIFAIGESVGPIAEEIAALAREAARRNRRHTAISVLPAASLHQSHTAVQRHRGGPLGRATMRMYEAMQNTEA